MNPQFVVQIPRGVANKCHVVVAVTQQYGPHTDGSPQGGATLNNKDSKSGKNSFHAIGFAVYEARPNTHRITTHFVAENVSGTLTELIFEKFELIFDIAAPPGRNATFNISRGGYVLCAATWRRKGLYMRMRGV